MIRLMAATIASRAPEAKHILITGDLPADQLTALAAALQDTGALRAPGGYRRREHPDLCGHRAAGDQRPTPLCWPQTAPAPTTPPSTTRTSRSSAWAKNILGCIVFE